MELAGVYGHRDRIAALMFEQQRAENTAFCRTVTTLYALYRTFYGDAEAELLALPSSDATTGELLARRKDLRLRETAMKAQVSVVLRMGADAADRALTEAVAFVERIPQVFALIGANRISVRAGREALHRSRVLTGAQSREFDERFAERLTRDRDELIAIPAIREAADLIVTAIDPHAAERRRERAIEDRTVVFRRENDGMACAYALLTAHETEEVSAHVEDIIATVCGHDPRTVAQRRADGLVALVRGCVTLGCQCAFPDCPRREARRAAGPADGVIVRYRTLITVVINERTLQGEDDAPAYLVGHGPITAQHAREIAQREDAVTRPFGERIDHGVACVDEAETAPAVAANEAVAADVPVTDAVEAVGATTAGASTEPGRQHDTDPGPLDADEPVLVRAAGSAGYRPSADLLRYLTLLYPRCVFPLCTRPASRCQIDHSREYDHDSPSAGGATAADNLQPLCIAHHQLKTAGEWIDARLRDGRILWTAPDGAHYIVDPRGPVHELFPDLRRVQWTAPPVAPPDYPAPAAQTRLQREHARRAQVRARSIALFDREPAGEDSPQSEFERAVEIAILQFTHSRRDDERRNAPQGFRFRDVEPHRGPPEPPHPDDEPPPF